MAVLLVSTGSAAEGEIPGSGDSRPNVLMIAVDDLNDWIGPQGAAGNPQAKTPHLDRLARRGVYFANAHAAVPVCMASRLAMFSGLRASTTGHYGNERLAAGSPLRSAQLLPPYLHEHGYRTLGGGKLYHHGTNSQTGAQDFVEVKPAYAIGPEWLTRSHGYGGGSSSFFQPFPAGGSPIVRQHGKVPGFSLCGGPLERQDIPRGIMPDEELAEWAIGKLGERHDGPFFLCAGFARPHVPYTAPREYFDLYDRSAIILPQVPADEFTDIPLLGKAMALCTLPGGDHHFVTQRMGPDYWGDLVHAYLACVSFVDAQIGRVLDALDGSPYAGNTLIVLWSDHGQHLGEKRHWRKMCLWEEATHMPLLWVLPDGRNAGRQCDQAVSLLDVAPTLIELLGLPPIPAHEGQSLLPLLEDPSRSRSEPAISTWHYQNHSVRGRHWRYIRYRDGSEELYDHRSDPGEHVNLAGRAEHADMLAEHRRWLPAGDVALAEDPHDDELGRQVERWRQHPEEVPDWLR